MIRLECQKTAGGLRLSSGNDRPSTGLAEKVDKGADVDVCNVIVHNSRLVHVARGALWSITRRTGAITSKSLEGLAEAELETAI